MGRVRKEKITVDTSEKEQLAQELAGLVNALKANAAALSALGNETRQLILVELLKNYGGIRVSDLADKVGLSRAAVSHHLKIMKDAGIADYYRVGTLNYYHASGDMSVWRKLAYLANKAEQIAFRCNVSESKEERAIESHLPAEGER